MQHEAEHSERLSCIHASVYNASCVCVRVYFMCRVFVRQWCCMHYAVLGNLHLKNMQIQNTFLNVFETSDSLFPVMVGMHPL